MTAELIERFLRQDEATCETEAIALGQAGQAGLTQLRALLASAVEDVRFWAVRGLAANTSPQAVALLIDTLQDQSEMVQSGAAWALGELKAETAIEALANLLTSDPSATGNHAADALGKIGQVAVPTLIEALDHKKAWVRVRAAKALVPIQDRRSIGPLFQALEDESYMVCHYAEIALTNMGVGQMVYFT